MVKCTCMITKNASKHQHTSWCVTESQGEKQSTCTRALHSCTTWVSCYILQQCDGLEFHFNSGKYCNLQCETPLMSETVFPGHQVQRITTGSLLTASTSQVTKMGWRNPSFKFVCRLETCLTATMVISLLSWRSQRSLGIYSSSGMGVVIMMLKITLDKGLALRVLIKVLYI